MTDTEIVKALECCKGGRMDCPECPMKPNDCMSLEQYAIDYIKRQQAEIEDCRKKQTNFADIGKMYSEIRAEAVKEFAEMVKLEFYREFDELIPSIMAERIDKLIEEMG